MPLQRRLQALAVMPRLSQRGGADRYLRALVQATPDLGWHAVYGHVDETGEEPATAFASLRRLKALSRRVPHPADEQAVQRLKSLIGELRPELVVVNDLQSPALLAALAAEPRAVAVVHDHRAFCPSSGKVLPGGERCREAFGRPCDACYVTTEGIDRQARDLGLGLVAARRDALARFACVVTASTHVAEELALVGLDPERILRIPPTPAPWAEACAARGGLDPASGEAIAFLGRIAEHKGALHLLEAVADQGLQVPLRFVGSGPAEAGLRRAAERLGLADRLTLTGWLSDDALPTALEGVRAVAMPSLWMEPFGMAGLDAARAGLPVVAHDVGGVRDWLEEGETGLLVPAADRRALGESLAALLASPARARCLGASARAAIGARYPVGGTAERWRELLAERVAPRTG